ncbi:MutL protein [Leptolyngbya boryana NIES-2135]|jgi:DNA mismatch repair protein MutL|uniref:DNA mismatch repair protein MutL n=1 Tax=Leptolyngbya boryana NIES-2135 TaxID=1973484 RepID=A0A1Z4JJ92_LEPBY|nr:MULTISPECIES: DNA mismatch repair endonuclease MutL [Leptolyngbya]BAY56733.1 MutL protein [Leptolyngbya boryana NIES-2135]MBD2369430.1 DNA mismatch repair endonuclease MutL [Leptolyngbya sp. FACHB-161]MBD2376825.1 DNA mismatch repair endonuclease MutL [Leptolyngbya sp. FACHB-238]MBD2401192.1 DNA mismatch repair endonuclease MutL [Leptolyngbya sp. FACHB-239]MBD2407743.1 DNA mismatch repair endonuclease MutL [Leptolyngbya sp. FACHB-402]
MGQQIQPLPIDVIHLIAAGEVIDSLAAVVRELVENAIDAGATRITVSIWADQWRVRVADNGAGMTLENLRQAAQPHSTSKIRDRADLWQIHSLGFRGEALHSLAQLSSLEILSRSASEPGWRVAYSSEGEANQIESVAIAPGTIVIVDRLFEIWEARREGLPSTSQQLKAIQQTIYQIALAHPRITWQVYQNDRVWFNLWGGHSAKDLLPQLLKDVRIEDLTELQSPGISVVLGLPDRAHRHRPDWVRVAVNGRFVKFSDLEQTILGAFRRTLPRDRHPICLVHLQLDPEHIDWNRHPAKAEVYLHHLDEWKERVKGTIAQALRIHPDTVPDSLYTAQASQLIKAAEAEAGYHVSREIQPEPAPFSPLKALTQVHNRYILAEHASGMWLIEQHIAHERVLFEEISDRWQLIPLDPAIVLNQLSSSQIEQLERIGIEVDPFGEQLWAVRSAPELLAQREDCADALIELSLGGDLQAAQVAVACRSAIRNGVPLSLEEMQSLIDRWQRTRNPRTCPHGRPIYLSLEESSLARFFRRSWVIGKSHGLE